MDRTRLSTVAALLGLVFAGSALAGGASSRHSSHPTAFVQQGHKLVGDHPRELSNFGGTVALSADGNTALVGAASEGLGDNGEDVISKGAAFVFSRSHGTWKRRVKLHASDQTRDAGFGSAVALSADGNTALVTGVGDSGGIGAAWLFARSHGKWIQQRSKLQGVGLNLDTDSGTGFGESAALSANGRTALVGSQQGAFVFARYNKQQGWIQEGPKLVATDQTRAGAAYGGSSVALSDNGKRALIGAGREADVFTRSPRAVWDLSSRLNDCPCRPHQGQSDDVSLAMSGDGHTVILGDSGYNISQGAAFVFSQTAHRRWKRRARLTATGTAGFNPYVGNSVAVSRDGRIALVGAQSDHSGVGAAWIFKRRGRRWSQAGRKLTARDEVGPAGNFASSLALSGDASTALIGGYSERHGAGGAWVFVARP